VISGTGTQTVGDEEFPITEGDTVYIPLADAPADRDLHPGR
jgi:mannose-6-phosphate isomerase-like protein (cupin superfamily)